MIVQRHFKEQSVLLLYSVFFVCSMFMLWELSIGRLFLLCYSIMFESYPPKGLYVCFEYGVYILFYCHGSWVGENP